MGQTMCFPQQDKFSIEPFVKQQQNFPAEWSHQIWKDGQHWLHHATCAKCATGKITCVSGWIQFYQADFNDRQRFVSVCSAQGIRAQGLRLVSGPIGNALIVLN